MGIVSRIVSVTGRVLDFVLIPYGRAAAQDARGSLLYTDPATRRIWARYPDGTAEELGGGAASSAPASADYLVKTANGDMSAERVVTDSGSVVVDWATAGQAIFRSGVPRRETVTTTTWWGVPQQFGGATLSTAATVDTGMRAVPFVAPKTGTIDLVAVEIVSGHGAGEEHIVAIYADDGTLYPGALIDDSESIDGSTAGVKTASVSADVKAGEMYWMVLYSEVAATFRAITVASSIPLLGYVTTLGAIGPGIRYTTTRAWDGTAPATFPGGATLTDSAGVTAQPAVWYRWGA